MARPRLLQSPPHSLPVPSIRDQAGAAPVEGPVESFDLDPDADAEIVRAVEGLEERMSKIENARRETVELDTLTAQRLQRIEGGALALQ